jgi:hypothetical protein
MHQQAQLPLASSEQLLQRTMRISCPLAYTASQTHTLYEIFTRSSLACVRSLYCLHAGVGVSACFFS